MIKYIYQVYKHMRGLKKNFAVYLKINHDYLYLYNKYIIEWIDSPKKECLIHCPIIHDEIIDLSFKHSLAVNKILNVYS